MPTVRNASGQGEPPEACFRRHSARIVRWATALGRTHADALDVAQEVFLRLLRSAPAFANDTAARGWLRTTTCRIAIDRWRRERTRGAAERRAAVSPVIVAPDDELIVAERRARLSAALGRLSEAQRAVVIAKLIDGLTFAEIAGELEVAPSTAKTHFVRGMDGLRRLLSEDVLEENRP